MQRAVEEVMRSVDPLLPMANFRTLDEIKALSLAMQRFLALLLGVMAALAALLAAIGVYSMMANSIIERTRKFGIRMAIGSTVRQAVLTAGKPEIIVGVAGLIAGTGLASLGGKLMERLIWGVPPMDAITYATVIAITLALIASIILALRIARINPACGLCEESTASTPNWLEFLQCLNRSLKAGRTPHCRFNTPIIAYK
ncbi:MAG TPA: FtsX-like permease family protein [Bryobacteraceae bacterium]|nr:FtsX-like permease family protein [Bryobacteraceae bacterium]